MQYKDLVDLSEDLGLKDVTVEKIKEFEPRSDGCSGGISFLYGKENTKISCHKVCVVHDYLYFRGGDSKTRKLSDKLLQEGCDRSGSPTPGWLDKMRVDHPKKAKFFCWIPLMRKFWRWIRSWIMYSGVRCFGWLFWNDHKVLKKIKGLFK